MTASPTRPTQDPETASGPTGAVPPPPPLPPVPAAAAAAERAHLAAADAPGPDSRGDDQLRPSKAGAGRVPRKKKKRAAKATSAVVPPPPKPEVPADLAAAQLPSAAREEAESSIAEVAEPIPSPDIVGSHDAVAPSKPEAVTAPAPGLEPVTAPEPEPEPVAAPEPEPLTAPEPEPLTAPEPEPLTAPEPEPEPVTASESAPELGTTPAPENTPSQEDSTTMLEALFGEREGTAAAEVDGTAGEEIEATATPTAVLPSAEPSAEDEAHPSPALSLTGVTKSFGQTRAVDAMNLEIPAGTFYGLVGPNGAGKTTTLSMIAGLLRPDAGRIEIAGIDLRRDPRGAKAKMGVLPDRLRTFDRLTGRQLLHYYGVLRGLRPAVVAERTADLARAFDLTAALGRPVADYSAGMTKKIMLAGAMIHAPRLLVLDEPFEAVDPVSSAVILDILSAYVRRGGTVVLSSHGMDLVERVCQGVAVIVSGQVLAQGTVDEVRGDHSLAERFVQLSGGLSDVEGLEWLHTYSD